MAQFHFDTDSYLELMLEEVPEYERLQEETLRATFNLDLLGRVLELGTGTGETARRVLARHPEAELIGIDTSEAMLARTRATLPRADLRVARLQTHCRLDPSTWPSRCSRCTTSAARRRQSCSAASPLRCVPAGALCWPTSSCPTTRRTPSLRSMASSMSPAGEHPSALGALVRTPMPITLPQRRERASYDNSAMSTGRRGDLSAGSEAT